MWLFLEVLMARTVWSLWLDIVKSLMTNLSEASNCIDHELLIVELYP